MRNLRGTYQVLILRQVKVKPIKDKGKLMEGARHNKIANSALYVAVVAMFTAMLSGGKFALMAIPNVEVVTLLIALFAAVWGLAYALPQPVIFVIIETFLWGFNTWVIEYFIHWPCVALLFGLLGKVPFKRNSLKVFVLTVSAVFITFLFGVQTSIVDTLLGYSSSKGFWLVTEEFWYRFTVLYARGLVFFVIHMCCNCILFSCAFLPLEKVFRSIKRKLTI